MINLFSKRSPEFQIQIQNETKIDFDKEIRQLIEEYIPDDKKKKLKGKRLKIIIPRDYKNTLYNLSPEEHKQHYDEFELKESNGHLILPTDFDATEFTILLNQRIFESEQYFSTIPHEITHIFDFTDYFNQYGNIFILDRKAKKDNFYFELYLWTEFNAKKIGAERFQKELDKRGAHINLEMSTEYFIEDVNREYYYLNKTYHLMHHFGRMAIYDDGLLTLNNELFPKDYLIKVFGENVMALYHKLNEINTYSEFNKEKEFIKYFVIE